MTQVIEINRGLAHCPHSVTNRENLEGAVGAAFQTMFGEDLHPTVAEKAAALLHGVAKAHGFLEGNKRTAWYTFVVFLEANGIILAEETSGYQDDLVVDIVEDRLIKEGVVRWIHEQIRSGNAVISVESRSVSRMPGSVGCLWGCGSTTKSACSSMTQLIVQWRRVTDGCAPTTRLKGDGSDGDSG